jgi:hypothetical protein
MASLPLCSRATATTAELPCAAEGVDCVAPAAFVAAFVAALALAADPDEGVALPVAPPPLLLPPAACAGVAPELPEPHELLPAELAAAAGSPCAANGPELPLAPPCARKSRWARCKSALRSRAVW